MSVLIGPANRVWYQTFHSSKEIMVRRLSRLRAETASAVVTTPKIAQALTGKVHFNTFGGNPVVSAIGKAVLEVIEKENLQANALQMGNHILAGLNKLKEKHPSVGDARAIGLFSLVELVKDRTTREPLVPYNPKPSEMGPIPAFNAFLRENGLFTFVRWNTCFVNPPLCITEQQLREGLAIIDRGLDIVDQAVA